MFRLGGKQVLEIVKQVDFGVYLGVEANAPSEERVLLPANQLFVPFSVKLYKLSFHGWTIYINLQILYYITLQL